MTLSRSKRRRMPAGGWWALIVLGYMWGYQEGRQFGQLEGHTRAMKFWNATIRSSMR